MTGKKTEDPARYGSRFEKVVDTFVGVFSPISRLTRMEAREKIRAKLSYASARSGREREPAPPLTGPNSPTNQLDQVLMIRRAEELARDSPFTSKILDTYRSYVVGSIEYIPLTGDKNTNTQYRDFWSEWTKQSDVTSRFHFIDQIQHAHSGTMVQGDHGLAHHHFEDGSFQIQNVEGECIGNPKAINISTGTIRGVVLAADGVSVAGYNIYRRTLYDQFLFDRFIPKPIFSHLNPVKRADDHKAATAFHAVLNEDFDVKDVIRAEKMAIKWASRKIAKINTSSGASPDAPSLDHTGGGIIAGGRPRLQEFMGEVMYGETGMEVDMITNERPAENVVKFLELLIDLYCMGVDLPAPFLWIRLGIPGTMTRLISEQAKRTFQDGRYGQKWLIRTALQEIKDKALISGVIRGKIPWCKNMLRGQFLFPAHPTVDVGRESDANLAENRQGITSMAEICGEKGQYWLDVDNQIREEAQNKLELGQQLANEFNQLHKDDKDFVAMTRAEAMQYIQMMTPNQSAGQMPQQQQDQ